MIGKAKIFLYALFSPNKHISPNKFKIKWYHKCILVLVRRCKNFKECPQEISYYEWQKAKEKYNYVYHKKMVTCLYAGAGIWLGLYLKKIDILKTQQMLEERKMKNLPEVEHYKLGLRPDAFHHKYNTTFPGEKYKYE